MLQIQTFIQLSTASTHPASDMDALTYLQSDPASCTRMEESVMSVVMVK